MRRTPARLIGRETELATLDGELREALGGTRRTLVLGGDAGIGKTRLLAEFARTASGHALVVTGQCVDLGPAPAPYAALTAIVAALIAEFGPDAVREAAGPTAASLGALVPSLAEAGAPPDAERLPDALSAMLPALARIRPLVVIVEDAHWADEATLAALRYVIAFAADAPLLLVVSFRRDDVGRRHPLRAALGELRRARLISELDLERLPDHDIRTLAEDLADGPIGSALLDELVERSEGVPFYVEELVPVLGGELPSSLTELLLDRYSHLEPETQRFLRIVAAGGVAVPDALLERVVEGGPEELERAARAAIEARILDADDAGYAFCHALLQEAVHAELLPGERTRLHARYAEALEETLPAEPTAADLAAVAVHWQLARDPVRALATAVRAARVASAASASSTAADLGQRALELWDEVPDPVAESGIRHHELLALTSTALYNSGRVMRALTVIGEAIAEWPEDDGRGAADALAFAALLTGQSGEGEGTELVARALELLGPDDDDIRAVILLEQTRRAMLANRIADAVELATRTIGIAERAGQHYELAVAYNLRGTSRVSGGDAAGMDDLDESRRRAGDDVPAILRWAINASNCLMLLERVDESSAVLEEGRRIAEARGGSRTFQSMLEGNACDVLIYRGEWDAAAARLERSLPLTGASVFSAYLREHLLWLILWRGDVEGAQAWADRHVRELRTYGRLEAQVGTAYLRDLAELRLEQDDPAGAVELVAGILVPDHEPAAPYDLRLLGTAARALAAAGATPAAVAPYRERLELHRAWPTYARWAALFEAEVGTASWKPVADGGGPAWLPVYGQMRLGETLLADGDRGSAREQLVAALADAERFGIGLVAQRVRRVLHEAGLDETSPPRRPDELTAREEQVLELIAEGLSNAQIAERLYISIKTVSVHVSAILRKTGAASRTEAVARRRAG